MHRARAHARARMINGSLPVAGMFEFRRECDEKYFIGRER